MRNEFDSEELINIASMLLQAHQEKNDLVSFLSNEAIYRSIINRSYYGAFLKARNKANIKNSGGSVHSEVISFYAKHKVTISNKLLNLKKSREKADYHTSSQISIQETKTALKSAKKVISELKNT